MMSIIIIRAIARKQTRKFYYTSRGRSISGFWTLLVREFFGKKTGKIWKKNFKRKK
jgi:hypothetical protein